MTGTVIIIADEDDAHALTVAKRIEDLGGTVYLLDSADFPTKWALNISIDADGARYRLRNDEIEIDGDNVAGVWWRRPHTYDPDVSIEEGRTRRFVRLEASDAFEGWLETLESRVINPVSADAAAHWKPYQLSVAAEVGLHVPKTLITNSPSAARKFNEQTNYTVFKSLSGAGWQMTETRRLDEEALDHIEGVSLAPVILQEEIRNKRDIRVTIIDNDVFAAEITPKQTEAKLDWRLDRTADIETHHLPMAVEASLRKLLNRLGLRFGAIDLAVTPDGEYVFLEVNPGGQWLFVEIMTGQPISVSLARALFQGGPPDQSRNTVLEPRKDQIKNRGNEEGRHGVEL